MVDIWEFTKDNGIGAGIGLIAIMLSNMFRNERKKEIKELQEKVDSIHDGCHIQPERIDRIDEDIRKLNSTDSDMKEVLAELRTHVVWIRQTLEAK